MDVTDYLVGAQVHPGRLVRRAPMVLPTRQPSSLCCRTRDSLMLPRPPVEAAGAVEAQTASTAPWKTTEQVFHSYHRPFIVCVFVLVFVFTSIVALGLDNDDSL